MLLPCLSQCYLHEGHYCHCTVKYTAATILSLPSIYHHCVICVDSSVAVGVNLNCCATAVGFILCIVIIPCSFLLTTFPVPSRCCSSSLTNSTLTIIVSSSVSIFIIFTSLLTSSHLFLHCVVHPHSDIHHHDNHFIINLCLHHHFLFTPHISPVPLLCSSSLTVTLTIIISSSISIFIIISTSLLTSSYLFLHCLFIFTHKFTLTIVVSSSISIFIIIFSSLLTSSHLFLHCAVHPHSQTHPHHNHFIINQYLHNHFHLTPYIISPVPSLCCTSSLTNSPSP